MCVDKKRQTEQSDLYFQNNEGNIKKPLLVTLYTLFIYINLPYAPAVRNFIVSRFGEGSITNIVGGILGAAGFILLIFLKKIKASPGSYLWLIVLSAIYIYFILTIPIVAEKVHFLQYGLLSIFVFSALKDHFNDPSVYIIGALLVFILGLIDEYIQGILPNRVAEIRDICWNGLAGLLVQIAFYKVIKPRSINNSVTLSSLKIIGIELMVIALAMGIFIFRS